MMWLLSRRRRGRGKLVGNSFMVGIPHWSVFINLIDLSMMFTTAISKDSATGHRTSTSQCLLGLLDLAKE